MLIVAGIGPGTPALLTDAARQAIAQAEILVGGRRQLALFAGSGAQTRLLDADIEGLLAWLERRLAQRVVVLASGDPLLYGIGNRLVSHFGADRVRIIPGISAIQYLCARAGVAMNDLLMTSSHGRQPDFDWLLGHPRVAMVTDQLIGPYQIAREIMRRGLSRTLIIGENLAQDNERIHRLAPQQVAPGWEMNVVVILDER
ncbi:cobalt-precorrin-7 (C(5))-methyltransferase [Entomohabitans teleogrylli]|uniref:cobalt-precorrin-7 (C(5))-methyltransferase n=1 Tax=Entomohabitans teleogrylli TaxID=1384589 RepID=UPI00073D9C46|nr:cobalt-precorrin-7 (C(5))-methyltransferase [Entomohabitans teleogrylli]